MRERGPISVLLPTVRWTAACEQVAAQLRPGDELLVICDTPEDSVAARDSPEGVEILVAGEPEECSGKANALAHGMERASHDRIVWTDADFERGDDWLETLVAAGETHGPATAVPYFYGGGWWRLLEPWAGVLFTLLFHFSIGDWAGKAWGGGVTFTREELTVDVPTLTAELRTVLSDDALLSERLAEVHPVRSLVMSVEVPGNRERVVARTVRFTRIVHLHGEGSSVPQLLVNLGLVAAAATYPLVVAPLLTAAIAVGSLVIDVRRPVCLFAYPGVFVLPLCTLAGILVREFEWNGRRYRYDDAGAVTVLAE